MTEGSTTAPVISPPLSFRYRCRTVLLTVLFLLFTLGTGAASPGDLLWEHASPELVTGMNSGLSPAVAPDGTVFFPCGASVDALAPDGALKWRRTFSFTNDTGHYVSMITPTIRRDGTVLVTPGADWGEDNLFALNPLDGSVLWSKPWLPLSIAEGQSGTFILDGRSDAYATVYLRSLDSNGNPVWSVKIPPLSPPILAASTLAIGPEGNIYLTGDQLRAYNQKGDLLWTNSAGFGAGAISIRDDGILYTTVGSLAGLSFDSAGHRIGYLPQNFFGAILPSGDAVAVRDAATSELISFDPQGAIRWTLPAYVQSSIWIGRNGDIYTIGSFPTSEKLSLLAVQSGGSVEWSVPLPEATGAQYGYLTVAPNGTFYIPRGTVTNVAQSETRWQIVLVALGPDSPLGTLQWAAPGHDAGNTRSTEKPFYAVVREPTASRTSVVLHASLKTLLPHATAIVRLGERADALDLIQAIGVPGPTAPGETTNIDFTFSDLREAQEYYYSLILSNGTAVVTLPIHSFETSGETDRIALTDEALRLAVIAGGTVTFSTNGTIQLTNAIRITRDTTLDAQELGITIDGGGLTRLFSVENASLTLKNLRLINALFTGTPGGLTNCFFRTPAGAALGGGIWASNANLLIENCVFSNNIALGGDGTFSLGCTAGINSGEGFGGAIYAMGGTVTIRDSTFQKCFARGGYGASIEGSFGPGESLGGALTLFNCPFRAESSTWEANAVAANGNRFTQLIAKGGAIFLTNSPAELTECAFRSNSASRGGAIFSDSALILTQCAFDQNSANGPFARLESIPGRGGAIFSDGPSLLIRQSTFTQNRAFGNSWGPGPFSFATDGEGGAIFASSLVATNTVFGLNLAQPGGGITPGNARGGAIYCRNAILDSCTIASNRAELPELVASGTAGLFSTNGIVELHSVIFANVGTNFAGALLDRGYNLSSDDSLSFSEATSRANIDVRLHEISMTDRFYGYFVPSVDSPAVNSGDPANYPQEDALGTLRPIAAYPDIGAVELTTVPTVRLLTVNGETVVEVESLAAERTSIEASEDLRTWTEVYVSPSGVKQFTYAPEAGARHRFYRAREQ